MNDYKTVRAWGKIMGSFDYYIQERIVEAKKDNAPANATYKNDDGTWNTTDNIELATWKIAFNEVLATL